MRKLLFLPVILLLLNFQGMMAQDKENENKNYVPVSKFDSKREPGKDLADAIKEAKKTNKKILLDVGGEWCIWCKKLDKFFDDNKDVANYMHKHFVVMKVYFNSKDNKNEEFLSKFPKIEGYPHIFILNKTGKLLHSQNTGDLESGDHHDRDKVYSFLKKWGGK